MIPVPLESLEGIVVKVWPSVIRVLLTAVTINNATPLWRADSDFKPRRIYPS